MKLLSAAQIKEADAYTIANEPIASIDLMERAADACTLWLLNNVAPDYDFHIFCGSGNNGGDGLAIARLLNHAGRKTSVYFLDAYEQCSDDFAKNLERLRALGVEPIILKQQKSWPTISAESVIIDALFGIGLNKALSGEIASLLNFLNSTNALKVAIDIPSGLYADSNDHDVNTIFKAHYTLTFQLPKRCFYRPWAAQFVGHFEVLDIGLNQSFISQAKSDTHLLTADVIAAIIKGRVQFSHKFNYGHGLLIAGSEDKPGAMLLAASATMRSGIGLLTVHTAAVWSTALMNAVPEAMLSIKGSNGAEKPSLKKFNAIGIGPGIGTSEEQADLLKYLLKMTNVPMVIDADALNLLAESKTWLEFLPPNCILTPHTGEFERLAGSWKSDEALEQKAQQFAQRYRCTLILKGAYSLVCCHDGEVFINSTGNAGMATAGSGDVLTGILTALLAQGYQAKQAACIGVFLHGLAGDFAAEHLGMTSMKASDLITYLPNAFKKFNV